MRYMNRPGFAALLATLLAALVSTWNAVQAQTIVGSTTFQVTATVLGQCAVGVTNLNFGNYAQNSATDVDAQSTLTVTCPNTVNYEMGLDGGLNTGGAFASRAMTGGSPPGTQLEYDVFQDVARTVAWGNTFGVDTQAATGTGAPQSFTVFGRAPLGQSPNPGAYQDTVTAIIFF